MFLNRKFLLVVMITIMVWALYACAPATPTEDPILKITSIAATVQAEITQTALAMPTATATLTPIPTATLSPATPTVGTMATSSLPTSSTGDNAKFDIDITIPDGSIIKPGAGFDKTWSLINSGTTTWTKDYQLMYMFGPQATVMSVKINKNVAPGESVQITVPFIAPTVNGLYTSWWQMYSASGYVFGDQVSVVFNVGNETATPTSGTVTATSGTPSVTGTPATETPTVTLTP